MTTHWQDDPYEDWDDDDYYDIREDNQADLWDDLDYSAECYYEPARWERFVGWLHKCKWQISHFWNYTLGMKKCSICGQRYQDCTNDHIPF